MAQPARPVPTPRPSRMVTAFSPDGRKVTASAGPDELVVFMDGDIPTVQLNGTVIGTLSLDADSEADSHA